jgi:arylsulfatase I/J
VHARRCLPRARQRARGRSLLHLAHLIFSVGWGDVSWHGAAGGATPHMAALVSAGVRLERLYTYHMCTPSRSSFLSGRLPIHVETALPNPESPAQGVPRNMTSVAAKLSALGWQTHVVGKWDLGMATPGHTPHGRGFDSSLIYFERERCPAQRGSAPATL